MGRNFRRQTSRKLNTLGRLGRLTDGMRRWSPLDLVKFTFHVVIYAFAWPMNNPSLIETSSFIAMIIPMGLMERRVK